MRARSCRVVKEIAPSPHGRGVEIIRAKNFIEALLGIFLQLELRREIVDYPCLQSPSDFAAALLHAISQSLLPLVEFRIVDLRSHALVPFVACAEDTVERIIISRRHWIILVIVTPRALHREG